MLKPISVWDSADWVVNVPNSTAAIKIQVKWLKKERNGKGYVRLTTLQSKVNPKLKRYPPDAFDFIVGYDGERDQAHVFSAKEVAGHKSCIQAGDHSLERWDKINAGLAQ